MVGRKLLLVSNMALLPWESFVGIGSKRRFKIDPAAVLWLPFSLLKDYQFLLFVMILLNESESLYDIFPINISIDTFPFRRLIISETMHK